MGDVRFERPYASLRRSADPARLLRRMSDEDVVAALASASRHNDPYFANTLATEALNRVHRARAVLMNLGEGVLTVDLDGAITHANPMAASLLGVSADELEGLELRRATGLDEPHMLDAARAGRSQSHDHARMRRADGAWFPVAFTMAPILSSAYDEGEHEVEGVVIAFSDTTERKRAEAELHLRSVMLDGLGEAVVASEPQGAIIFWNPAAERLFGWSAREALGRSVMDLVVPPESRERAVELMRDARQGHGEIGSIIAQRKGGERVEIAFSVAPVTGEEGQILAIVGVATDLTEARREEAETRLRAAMLDAVGEAVTAVDASGSYVYWNKAAERMTGWAREEVLGRTALEFIVPPGWESAILNAAERLMNGETFDGEAPVKRRDGSVFRAKITAVPLAGPDGRVTRVVGTWADVTEHERARAALEGARAFLQSALDGFPFQVAIVDSRGVIVSVNRAWREAAKDHGLRVSRQAVGASYLDECERAAREGEPEAARDAAAIRAALEGGRVRYTREYAAPGDGEPRWFVMRVSGFRDAVGRPFAIVSHADSTPVHHAAAVHSVLEAVAESIPTAAFATTLEGKTIVWNRAATELFGYAASQIVGRPADRVLDGSTWEDRASIRARVDAGQTVDLPRASCVSADGERVLAHLTLTPVRDADGAIVAVWTLATPASGP